MRDGGVEAKGHLSAICNDASLEGRDVGEREVIDVEEDAAAVKDGADCVGISRPLRVVVSRRNRLLAKQSQERGKMRNSGTCMWGLLRPPACSK